ncbi:hypothetical protein LRB11_14755 [Ectothiorhodospira haloalkaliphila]|uniref:hypothetical protein n=1 Tax=Ectothiorhodospira haloalkaliphila TaxID=421628 RepID=UPI001EE7BC63|nr:hypothetical protein [Ectothiorhodospira haloalkaliphila]MCG5526175.1 hypothetical protein [Ectothiorhodospira haloalkaliphila]
MILNPVKSPYILKQLIDHRDIFVQLVAYVDANDGDVEIPIRVYRNLVKQAISVVGGRGADAELERRRLQQTLDEENLQHERLIVHIDRVRGVMVMAPFLMDMLRHFDVRRMQGLSQAELEDLRSGLNRSLAAFDQVSLDVADDDFREELRLLRRRIQDTQAKMRESVAGLKAQGEHLAEVVDQQDIASLEGADQARRALEHINRIYQRHILPALEFLDPKTAFQQGVPAVNAIRSIARRTSEAELPKLTEELVLAANAIQSYVNDINELRLSLERYVRQNKRQRDQYDRIERAFNALRQAAEERHDDSLRNKYIPIRHPAIQSPGTFRGIRRIPIKRIDWYEIDHKADIEEFTDRRIAELRAQRDREGSVSVDPLHAAASEVELAEQQRHQQIQALLEDWEIPRDCQDLHAALHDRLRARLDGYSLHDLLEALDWIMAMPHVRYRARFQHCLLVHDDLELSYHPLIPHLTTEDDTHER